MFFFLARLWHSANGVASWSMQCWFGAKASLTPVNPLHSALLFLAAIWLHHPGSDAGTAVSTANQSEWLRLKLFKTKQVIACESRLGLKT